VRAEGQPTADLFGRTSWQFYVPGQTEQPRLVYASCNGFSTGKLAKTTRNPYLVWATMRGQHAQAPFSLLIMGGDQLYADELWKGSRVDSIVNWSHLARDKQLAAQFSKKMERQLDAFYQSLYLRHWRHDDMAYMLASVPSLMMWDDHDIFDGWGSYPDDLQGCRVYQGIFVQARRYFELMQMRTSPNPALPGNQALIRRGGHFSFGLTFRNYVILGLDHRSERRRNVVMSSAHWDHVKSWLASYQGNPETLLVLSAIPVVYRSFSLVERFMDATTWEEELEDDIHDHWTAKPHQGERVKLIHNLLFFSARIGVRHIIILSGDVHVGGLGVIKEHSSGREIVQVISSGIVHPPPTFLQWFGLQAVTTDRREVIGNGDLTAEMISPFGADKYIRSRNYVTLETMSDDKVWVNWICEKEIKPEFGIAPTMAGARSANAPPCP